MKNYSSTEGYAKPASFSIAEIAAGNRGAFKSAASRFLSDGWRQVAPMAQKAASQPLSRPVVEPSVVSRYDLDFFGRPRVLSEFEILAYTLARLTLVGVVLGFLLSITFFYFQQPSRTHGQEIASTSVLVELPEDEP